MASFTRSANLFFKQLSTSLSSMLSFQSFMGGERGLVVGRWTCNPEVPGSSPSPCHWMDLSSVAPNSIPPRLVNSQPVSLPPVGILNLLCLIAVIGVEPAVKYTFV